MKKKAVGTEPPIDL